MGGAARISRTDPTLCYGRGSGRENKCFRNPTRVTCLSSAPRPLLPGPGFADVRRFDPASGPRGAAQGVLATNDRITLYSVEGGLVAPVPSPLPSHRTF